MGVVILPLAIGVALGLIVAIWQTIRISTGANTKIIRNPDGSVYHPVGTIIGIFILWSLVCSVIAFIMIALINLGTSALSSINLGTSTPSFFKWGTLIRSLVIGLTIGLFISIFQAIRFYMAIAYLNKNRRLTSEEFRKTGKVLQPDYSRTEALVRPVFNIVGFPILCSLIFFVIALIVMFFIK